MYLSILLSVLFIGWRDVISVGAIDCAQDVNSPICRDYEVQGYSLKSTETVKKAGSN